MSGNTSHNYEAAELVSRYSSFGANSGFALLNEAEAILPDSLLFNLHFDMIVKGGMKAVSEYHKLLSQGKNKVLEQVRSHLSKSDIRRLDEAILVFKKRLEESRSTRIDEEADALAPPDLALDLADTQDAISPTSNKSTESSFFSLENLRKIASIATEDFSPVGSVQFLLDLVGMFGDFAIPGLGIAADLINAAIYVIRAVQPNAPEGMWVLAIISAAAAIPGWGMIAPFSKGAAKSADRVIRAGMKSSDEMIREFGRIPAENKPLVMKVLTFISKIGVGIVSKLGERVGRIGSFLAKEFKSWFPVVSQKIDNIFKRIGSNITKFRDGLKRFSDSFTPSNIRQQKKQFKADVDDAKKLLSDVQKTGGGSWKYDPATDQVEIFQRGQKIKTIPGDVVWASWKKKLPNMFADGKPISREAAESLATYAGYRGRLLSSLLPVLKKGELLPRVIMRVGIFAIKVLYMKQTATQAARDSNTLPEGFTEDDAMNEGLTHFNEWLKEKHKEQKEKTGASYVPYVTLSQNEEGAVEHVHNEINRIAGDVGTPEVIDVAYNRFKNDESMKQFKDFWELVEAGKIKTLEDGTFVRVEESILRHIIPYSKFV